MTLDTVSGFSLGKNTTTMSRDALNTLAISWRPCSAWPRCLLPAHTAAALPGTAVRRAPAEIPVR